jgi:hypothetical protein
MVYAINASSFKICEEASRFIDKIPLQKFLRPHFGWKSGRSKETLLTKDFGKLQKEHVVKKFGLIR